MKLESVATIMDFDPYSQSQYGPTHNFGECVKLADGRWFRYALDSGSGNTKGHVQLAQAVAADSQNMAVYAVAAIGSTQITATYGTTAANAGLYDEGYAMINAGTGLGQLFKIRHSSKSTASASTDPAGYAYGMIFDLFEPLKVATDATTSKLSVIANGYNLTRETTGSTLRPAGVPLISATASYYYWAQTRGVAAVICSSTGATIGYSQVNSASTTAATTENAGTAGQVVSIGYALYTGASAEYRAVMLTIN